MISKGSLGRLRIMSIEHRQLRSRTARARRHRHPSRAMIEQVANASLTGMAAGVEDEVRRPRDGLADGHGARRFLYPQDLRDSIERCAALWRIRLSRFAPSRPTRSAVAVARARRRDNAARGATISTVRKHASFVKRGSTRTSNRPLKTTLERGTNRSARLRGVLGCSAAGTSQLRCGARS